MFFCSPTLFENIFLSSFSIIRAKKFLGGHKQKGHRKIEKLNDFFLVLAEPNYIDLSKIVLPMDSDFSQWKNGKCCFFSMRWLITLRKSASDFWL